MPQLAQTKWDSGVWARVTLALAIFALAAFLADRSVAATRALNPLCIFIAGCLARVLHWLGMDCLTLAATLVHAGGFSYQVALNCTGVIPAGLLLTAILLSSGPLLSRVRFAAVGALAVLLLNFARLITLFYLGLFAPRLFAIAHSVVWQAVLICFMLGYFYGWKARSCRQPARLFPRAADCKLNS